MKTEPYADLTPGLYLVATPIGNLRDITLRALDVLAAADAVACEDTRVTGRLLQAHGIKKPLILYNDHSDGGRREALLKRLAGGERIALVSDAGTPLVSDPGFKLVRACAEAGIAVTALPGPSAALAALSLSALPSDAFVFAGFPPPKQAARRAFLTRWKDVPATAIFFETAPRLTASLADMAAVFGGARPAALTRELTKLFEEVRRGTLADLAAHYESEGPPKGEIVLVVGPPPDAGAEPVDEAALADKIRQALKTMSVKEAAEALARETGLPRRTIYEKAVRLGRES